jgi:hypothetical protein
VFQSIHDPSDPGTKVTAKLIAHLFVWPGMQKDCRTWARVCQACQRSKIPPTTQLLWREISQYRQSFFFTFA